MNTLFDRLERIREDKRINKSAICSILGIQLSHYSKLKDVKNPSIKIVQKLKEAYPDINLDWVLMGKGSMYEGRGDGDNNIRFYYKFDKEVECALVLNEVVATDDKLLSVILDKRLLFNLRNDKNKSFIISNSNNTNCLKIYYIDYVNNNDISLWIDVKDCYQRLILTNTILTENGTAGSKIDNKYIGDLWAVSTDTVNDCLEIQRVDKFFNIIDDESLSLQYDMLDVVTIAFVHNGLHFV